MKIIVTHKSPDMDGITSIWLIKKYFSGWENAKVKYVMAGERLEGSISNINDYVEKISGNDVVHVDTGFGKFDHHQIQNCDISAASLVLDHILQNNYAGQNEIRREALRRLIKVIVEDDHFQEVYYKDTLEDYQDFSLFRILDGIKMEYIGNDDKFVELGLVFLDALIRTFENKVWAEKELTEKGVDFKSQWGKALAIESVNDTVLDIAQKRGYVIVMRKDPSSGFVRIKAKPCPIEKYKNSEYHDVNLTIICEQLKKMDPDATWFLHVSKKLLLNGSSKNPKMHGTKLTLPQIIEVFESFVKK